MRATPELIAAAERDLARDALVGPAVAPLVRHHGPCPIGRRRARSHFEALARAVVFQQLAGAAAGAIWQRVRRAAGGPLRASAVLAVPPDTWRAAGLSGAKAAALRDLAERVAEGSLDLRAVARRGDDEVVEALTAVRGIGRWTAEMFLIFQLGRPDVWPAGDLGVRKGYAALAGLATAPPAGEMPALGARFAPHRSVAAWYCWRAAEAATPG